MRILKLELQNINSLRSSVPIVIDFSSGEFKDTGLFAITGPTGAGKTTLLDAITIALYRQVPRFNKSHIKSGLFDVVSKGAGFAMTRVTFSNDGKVYEAYWEMKLKSNTGRTYKNPQETIQLQDITEGKIIAEKKNEFESKIEAITRLNFNQFLRSMMLAQGEFASFLKADKKDKVALLDQIIGNDIYRLIGYAVAGRISSEKDILQQIESKMNTENLLSDEEKKLLITEKEEIEKELKELSARETAARGIADWYKNFGKLNEDKERLKTDREYFGITIEENAVALKALRLHSKTGPFIGILSTIEQFEKDIVQGNGKITVLNDEIERLKKELLDEKEILKKVEEGFLAASRLQKDWQEPLEEVTSLDSTINEKRKNINEKRKNVAEIEKEIEKLKKGKRSLQKDLEDNGKKLKEIKSYLDDNENTPLISAKITGWTVDLEERKRLYHIIKESGSVLEKLSINIKKNEKELTEKTGIEKAKNEERQSLQKQIDEITGNLASYEPETLQEELTTLVKRKELFTKAVDLSNRWFNVKEKKEKDVELLEKFEKDLKKQSLELENADERLENGKQLLEQLEHNRELELKIKDLAGERKKLKEGEPCPLCGSVSHPYVEKYENHDFDETTKHLEDQKKKVDKLVELRNELVKKKTETETLLKSKTEQIAIAQKDFNNYRLDFEKLKIDTSMEETRLLQDEFNSVSQNINRINENIGKTNKLQKEKAEKERKLKIVNEELTKVNGAIIRAGETVNNLKEKVANIQNELAKNNEQLTKLENKLSEEFVSFNFVLPGVGETADFLDELKKKIGKYEKLKDEKQNKETEAGLLQQNIDNLIKRISERDSKKKELTSALDNAEDEFKILLSKRNDILPQGVSVKQKRDELELNTGKAGKLKKEHEEKLKKFETLQHQREAGVKTIANDINERKREINKLSTELDRKIALSDFNDRGELLAAVLDKETVEKYTIIEKNIEEKKIELQTREKEIAAKEAALRKSKDFEESERDVNDLLERLGIKKDDKNKRTGEINNKFDSDRLLRVQNEQTVKEIDTQKQVIAKWEKLFNLLGGTKDAFNIYVQRLTLKSLVNHANLHLQKLNDRYSLRLKELEKNEELNMEIIDHYQTDMARPVETSSGGESFILSLALALGLSDLASRNVKVESLFIDEGFGTLDDELLDMVISTLATLQSQGKTIGVISHVEKLKDRISTRIQVSKKGNGVSGVEIFS